jgi:DNA-binding transcriptional LysR family regulator
MDIRRLQHLVVLADEGNFRRAAERVHLSQPAFSRSIQAAEAELGLKLFDRGTLEARCTPSGAFVVDRARALLQQNQRLERDVALYRERAIGDLAFGSGPFPAATLVPAMLVDLRKRFPGAAVRLQVNNSNHLLGCVKREEHDFFVANTREVPADGTYEVRSIGRLPGGFYVRRDHPLLAHKSPRVADLLPYGIGTGRLPDDVGRHLVKLMGLPEGHKLPLAVECDDVHLLKNIAKMSDTVIIGTEDLLATEIADKTMSALALKDFGPAYSHSYLGIVTLAGRTPSPLAAYAMEMLAQLAHAGRAAP